jgi:metal-responsive CopG/Arc/MetJ family transcriptional regulator
MVASSDMARRQVIVQLDDDLVDALDREAEALGVSRSELLRRAASALLAVHDLRRKETAHRRAYEKDPQDPDLTRAFTRLAADTMEPW